MNLKAQFWASVGSLLVPAASFLAFFITFNTSNYKKSPKHDPHFFVCGQKDPRTWCTNNNTIDVNISKSLASLTFDGQNWIPKHDNFKDYATASHVLNFIVLTVITVLYIFFSKPIDRDQERHKYKSRFSQLFQFLFVLLTSLSLAEWAKHTANRLRPAYYFGLQDKTEAISGNSNHDVSDKWASFFSGDTAVAWSSFLSLLFFTNMYANIKDLKLISIVTLMLSFSLAMTGTFFRVMALMHWFSDVLTAVCVVFILCIAEWAWVNRD